MSIIPNLADDISLRILALVPCSFYRRLSAVCRAWRDAFCANGPVFATRKRLRIVEPWIVLVSTYMNEPCEFLLLDPVHHGYLQVSPPQPRRFPKLRDVIVHGVSIAVLNPIPAGDEILMPIISYKSHLNIHNWQGWNADKWNCFNLHSMEWTKPVSLLRSNACQNFGTDFACTTLDGYVYFGGGLGGQYILQAARLDIASRTWEALPDLIEKRRGAFTVVLHGCLCIIGGFSPDSAKMVYSGEIWDPNSRQWTLVPELWPANVFGYWLSIHSSVAVVKDRLFVLMIEQKNLLYYEKASKRWISMGTFSPEVLLYRECGFHIFSADFYKMVGVDDTLFVFYYANLLQGETFMAALYVKPTISEPLTWGVWPLCRGSRAWWDGSVLISHV